MTHAQFMRIETKAGGIAASNMAFIRSAHTLLSRGGRSANQRGARKAWLKLGLGMRAKASAIASA